MHCESVFAVGGPLSRYRCFGPGKAFILLLFEGMQRVWRELPDGPRIG
jgi:hypothetical protein